MERRNEITFTLSQHKRHLLMRASGQVSIPSLRRTPASQHVYVTLSGKRRFPGGYLEALIEEHSDSHVAQLTLLDEHLLIALIAENLIRESLIANAQEMNDPTGVRLLVFTSVPFTISNRQRYFRVAYADPECDRAYLLENAIGTCKDVVLCDSNGDPLAVRGT